MSQGELAKAAGVDVRQIRRYETSDQYPVLPVAVRLAEALGVTLDEMTSGLRQASPPGPAEPGERTQGLDAELGELRERVDTLDTEMDKMGSLLAHLIGVLDEKGIDIGSRAVEGLRVEAERGERRAARDR